MKNKVVNLLQNAWGLLIFALLSGCAYYVAVLKFIIAHTSAGGGLLGFFFFPAIIAGAALVIVKLVKQCIENGQENKALAIFYIHAVFILIGIVFLISML
ncbi:MAG: hypothetical protein IJX57_00335 [Clostridia bacterium]|nr:hypothetical protein [Clostridia bacterium]